MRFLLANCQMMLLIARSSLYEAPLGHQGITNHLQRAGLNVSNYPNEGTEPVWGAMPSSFLEAPPQMLVTPVWEKRCLHFCFSALIIIHTASTWGVTSTGLWLQVGNKQQGQINFINTKDTIFMWFNLPLPVCMGLTIPESAFAKHLRKYLNLIVLCAHYWNS